MKNLLEELIGRRVAVHTMSGEAGFYDSGILEAFDGIWMRILDEDKHLYFSVYNIRLVKPLDN